LRKSPFRTSSTTEWGQAQARQGRQGYTRSVGVGVQGEEREKEHEMETVMVTVRESTERRAQ